ncbi:MAG: glycosyltransferase family 4 protein [Anaerolineales bacterium]|nr:glycosyltransferase family 4 protein [Anaerolineales bacterium]
MRILVLVHEYPPIGGGGGKVAQDICRGLARRGHELHVLTAHVPGLPREAEIDGMRVTRLPSGRRSRYKAGLGAMSGFVLAGFFHALRLTRAWKPHLIHAHFAVPAGPIAWGLHRACKLPYVLTIHLGDIPGGVPEKTSRWFRWIYPLTPPIWREAARVIAVSQYSRDLAARRYPVDIQVIPNGVEVDALRPGSVRAGDPPCIAFAGRFVPQKDPLTLVRALLTLSDLPWRCILIGDGELRGRMEQAISESGLQERFLFTGWVSPEEVLQRFAASDILFMPSLSEGMPVAGLQALAMGLAIVASRVGAFPELVDEGRNGYLAGVGDVIGFSQALRKLLGDRAHLQRCREASLEKASAFDLEAVTEAYHQALLDVAGA